MWKNLCPMKFKFLYLFAALIAKTVFADEAPCGITSPKDEPEITWSGNKGRYMRKAILMDSATLNIELPYQGTIENLTSSSAGTLYKYINAKTNSEKTQIEITTNNHFAQFDEDTEKQTNNPLSTLLILNFKCEGQDTQLEIYINVEDTNNHDPEFEKPSYVYTLPMPMIPKYDLTSLGEPIYASDIDFSNKDVTFTIDPVEHFLLETVSLGVTSKKYGAKLMVSEYSRLSQDTDFTLTVTDSGTPPRTKTTQITIKVDDSSSEPDNPTFSKPSYTFKYSIQNEKPVITTDDGPIAITTSDPNDLTVDFKDAQNYFKAEYNATAKEVTISSTGTAVDTTEHVMVLTLKVTSKKNSNVTSAAIILIDIPEENVIAVPVFSKPYYMANYSIGSDKDTVTLEEAITVSPTESVEISLTGDKNSNFIITKVDGKWQLEVQTNLDPDDLKKGGDIILTLKASVTGADAEKVDDGFATLVIQLPVVTPAEPPKFEKPHYSADYQISKSGTDTLKLIDGPITVTASEDITVTFESTYKDYFDLQVDPQDSSTYTISVKQDLTSAILNKEAEILITLKATSSKEVDPGISTVIISLPKDIAPKFSKPSYKAQYEIDTNGNGNISTEEIIQISTIAKQTVTVTIKNEEYQKYFGIVPDSENSNNYKLSLKENLPEEILQTHEDIVLTLQADLADTVEGLSTFVISLPQAIIPTFSKSHYSAAYEIGSDGNGKVTVNDGPIEITSPTDRKVTVVIVEADSNSDHFNIAYNTNKEIYELSVKNNLDDETLIKEADIVLTLQATIDGTPAVGTATLIIKLPKKVAPPSFSLPFYDATYVPSTSGGKDVIQLNNDETITLEGDNIPETTVSFDAGEYTDNFKISSTAPYTLSVETNIEQTVLYTKDEIIVTLTAALKDSTLTSKASVKIALPGVPVTPKFSTAFYTAKYDDKAATVTVEGEKISTDAQDPSLAIITVESPYDSNFKLEYNKDTKAYDVNVIAPLDSTTVDRETQIIVILEVTTTYAVDKTTATLLITMPEKITDVVPEFSEINYVAVYTVVDKGADTVNISSARPIKITSDHETDTVVKVTGNYESNFETQKGSDGSWQIVVKANLDEKTLKENKEIVVTLEASLTGNEKVGRAAVILGLPDRNLKPTPTFSKPYYTANYTVDAQGAASLALTEPILITSKADLDLISVTFTPYDKNFQINRDDTNIAQWNMALTDPLDQAIVDANTEITITLTATLDDSVGDGTATLIIKLPPKEIVTVSFDKSYYKGTYTDNDKDDTVTNDVITVQPSDATVTVDGDYKSNFATECKAGKCTLKVTNDLSSDILSSETRITIAIKATHADAVDTGAAAVIIDLPLLNVKPAPTFTKTYYTVLYEVDDSSTPSLNLIDGPIKINSEFEDSVEVNLQSYSENFGIKRDPATAEWTLTLKKPLDDQTLIDNREIAVELKAHLDQAAADASATLLFKLPEKAVIQFVKPYYTANYTIHTDADDTVESEEITVNVKDVTVTIKSDEEFKENFEIKKANEKYSLVVVKKLGDDVLENKKEILLVLEASKTGINEKGATTVIIKLPLQDENITPEFSKDVYTASYINDATASVKLDSKITVENVDPTKVSITIEGGYSDNFAPVFETNQWKLNVIKPLAEETLSQDVSILLRLQAKAENIVTPGKAAVVIKLPKQVSPTSIVFSNNVYMANYEEENKNFTVEEEITIEGDPAGNANVALDVNNENAKYFSLSYKDEKVNITLKNQLPDAVIKEQAAISVDIIAKNSKDTIKATLVVKLPHTTSDGDDDCSSDDKSGLIAAIAVLAVLLVAAIVGSAVFYYVKFRRVSAYDNMDDPTSHSERFKRNSNTGTKNKFEHPTRRPTGVIKYPINNDDPGETTTEEEFPEKRKSVQFDTINIDELEIEPEKPEDDDMYENVFENAKEVSNGEDDRNSSES